MPCCEWSQSQIWAWSTPWPQGLRHQQLGAGFGSPGCSRAALSPPGREPRGSAVLSARGRQKASCDVLPVYWEGTHWARCQTC